MRSPRHHSIEWFEQNLQSIGVDTSDGAGSNETTAGIENETQLIESMRQRLPSKQTLFLESLVHMRKIKITGKGTRNSAQERERRRRKQAVQTAKEAEIVGRAEEFSREGYAE